MYDVPVLSYYNLQAIFTVLIAMLQPKLCNNKHILRKWQLFLVGGFNPFEKY